MTSLSDLSATVDYHAERMANQMVSIAFDTAGVSMPKKQEWPMLMPTLIADCYDILASVVMYVLKSENTIDISEMQDYFDEPACAFAEDILAFILHNRVNCNVPLFVVFSFHSLFFDERFDVPEVGADGSLIYKGESYECVTS